MFAIREIFKRRLLGVGGGVVLSLAATVAAHASTCDSILANLNQAKAAAAAAVTVQDRTAQTQNMNVLQAGYAACLRVSAGSGSGVSGYVGGYSGGGNNASRALAAGSSIMGNLAGMAAIIDANNQQAQAEEQQRQAEQAEREEQQAAQSAMQAARDANQRAAVTDPFGSNITSSSDNPFAASTPSSARPGQAEAANPFASSSTGAALQNLKTANDNYFLVQQRYGANSPQALQAKRTVDLAVQAVPADHAQYTQAKVDQSIANLNAMGRGGPAPTTGASSTDDSGCRLMAANLKAAMDAVNATQGQVGHDSQVQNMIVLAGGFGRCAGARGQGIGSGTELRDALRLAQAARQLLVSPGQTGDEAELPGPDPAQPAQVGATPSGPQASNCDNQPQEQLSPTGAYKSIGCIPTNVAGRPYMGPPPSSSDQGDEPATPGEMTSSAPVLAQALPPTAPPPTAPPTPAHAAQPTTKPLGDPREADDRPGLNKAECESKKGQVVDVPNNPFCLVGSTWYHLAS